ncbi:MAG: PAS domain S-box protein, partial [Chloroflexi bacterium]|nr:PAS domain S-box protein [Chloroflexota bacterium]
MSETSKQATLPPVAAQSTLEQTEARYQSFFDGVPVGLYRTMPEGRILDANPALVQMLGYPDRESLLTVNTTDFYVNPEVRWRWQALMDREGVVGGFEAQLLRHDGTSLWVRDNARSVHDTGGQLLYYEGSLEDITGWVDTREALRKSKSELENRKRFITLILESIPSSLVVLDRSLRIVSANRNFLEKTRRKEQATLGLKFDNVFPHVLLEYTRLDQKVRKIFLTGRGGEGGTVAYRAPGVSSRTYYYRLIPIKEKETVENVLLLMDDITEREQLREEVQRAERHLASVVDCANDLVISMDQSGHIVTWNRAAERITGLRTEQIKGQSLLKRCAAEQRPVMAEMLQGLIRGKSIQNTEVNLLTADGQAEVPIAWSCSPMLDGAGGVIGIVVVGRDLTERHQLEAQLIHSTKMASLGVMAGGIAHELRNPLGIISASAQLLLEHPDDT